MIAANEGQCTASYDRSMCTVHCAIHVDTVCPIVVRLQSAVSGVRRC